jgi:predicted RND superfamily exporter protein
VLTGETIGWMDAARREIITRHGDSLKPVISPPEVLDFLGARPTDAQVAAALRLLPSYLSASVVTPERDMAVMTYGVDLDDVGRLGELRDYLGAVAAGAPGSVDVELAGLPMVAVSAHQALQQDRLLTAVLGVLAAGAILLLLLPRRSVALLAMVSAAAASGLVMLGMVVTGLALTPMTAGLGSLTAAVACEFTVVLAHAHRVGDRRIRRAVDLAAAASATGYSVLALSDLGLIRGFGLLLAMTVVVALGVSRLLVWAVVDHPRDTERDTRDEKSVARAEEPRTLEVVG